MRHPFFPRHLSFVLRRRKSRALLSEDGSATVEFVILFPLLFAMFLTSVDFSVQMLRQVFLDRSVDLVMREIRLGANWTRDPDELKAAICANSALTPNCMQTITLEMRPVTATELATIDRRTQCVNRAQNIQPVVTFTPGAGQQELMMMRVCTVSNPFIVASGLILGNPRGPNDDFFSVSMGIFVNEPA